MGICYASRKYSPIQNASAISANKKLVMTVDKLMISTIVKNSNKITKEYKISPDQIGKGAYGEVRRVLHLKSGTHRAVKILYKHECTKEELKKIINEIEILRQLDHPNIIKVYEYFEDFKFIYIIMELASGGELFEKIQSIKKFTEVKAAEIYHQILSGVNYLHKNHIVHRDLKPENILFDGDVVKIVDFGTSKNFEPDQNMRERFGTPHYIAPEVLKGDYNEKCDVWSCGVILYIMLSGRAPFSGRNKKEVFQNIINGKYTLKISEFKARSSAVKKLLKKMLEYSPTNRITIEEAINHYWFKIIHKEEAKYIPISILDNIKNFHTKNKMQKSIYFFLVNQLASRDEKQELIKIFKSLDSNNDGVLSKEELLNGLKNIDMNLTETDIDELISRLDNNMSQTIDYTEFVAAAINRASLLNEERMLSCFRMFDKDKSGKISVSEIKAILQGDELVSENVWEDLINQADENGDGEIEYAEFKDLLLKMVTR